jgi:GT2 family glycosyltransferase
MRPGDGTREMVAAEFPSVRLLVNDTNIGFARGNNQALACARGHYVLLLNPDTLVPPGTLARCVEFSGRPAGEQQRWRDDLPGRVAGWIASARLRPPAALAVERNVPRFAARPCVLPFGCVQPRAAGRLGQGRCSSRAGYLGAFMLIRRAAINALPGGVLLDSAFFLMYEDVDLCKRLGDAGFAIWYWPDAHIVHLGGQSTRQRPILTYATSHVSALTYFRKHHPRAVPWLRAIPLRRHELEDRAAAPSRPAPPARR